MRDDALIGVVIRIERQRLQTLFARWLRWWNACDDGFKNIFDADALLGAARDRPFARHRQHVLQLLQRLRNVRVTEINLVDDRNDRQVLFRREMIVGDRLRLDPLRRINHQQRAFARAQAPGNFIREIHVTGSINQVQLVGLAVLGLVKHRDRMRLDGDAALLLQIHGVEQLLGHIARGDGTRHVQQAIRKRRLPMVNVGDDAEITYMCGVH